MTDEFTTQVGDTGSIMPVSEKIDDSPKKVLDELRSELERVVEKEIFDVEIPERPNVNLRFNPNFGQSKMTGWRNNSGQNKKKGMDTVKFSSYVVGDTCIGIFINGKEVTNEDGIPLTFGSEEIWDMTNASNAFESIRDMFGVEPHIETTALKIIERAGYGDEIDVEDPFDNG